MGREVVRMCRGSRGQWVREEDTCSDDWNITHGRFDLYVFHR